MKLYVVFAARPVIVRLVASPLLCKAPFIYRLYPVAPVTTSQVMVAELLVIFDAVGCPGVGSMTVRGRVVTDLAALCAELPDVL